MCLCNGYATLNNDMKLRHDVLYICRIKIERLRLFLNPPSQIQNAISPQHT